MLAEQRTRDRSGCTHMQFCQWNSSGQPTPVACPRLLPREDAKCGPPGGTAVRATTQAVTRTLLRSHPSSNCFHWKRVPLESNGF